VFGQYFLSFCTSPGPFYLERVDGNLAKTSAKQKIMSTKVRTSCAYYSLSYYHSIKQAAQMNIPGAKAIYEDLKVRFASNGNRKATEGVK
jgi:hypothetical protein